MKKRGNGGKGEISSRQESASAGAAGMGQTAGRPRHTGNSKEGGGVTRSHQIAKDSIKFPKGLQVILMSWKYQSGRRGEGGQDKAEESGRDRKRTKDRGWEKERTRAGVVIAEERAMGPGERERSVPSDYVLCTLYFGGFGGRCAVILAGTRG